MLVIFVMVSNINIGSCTNIYLNINEKSNLGRMASTKVKGQAIQSRKGTGIVKTPVENALLNQQWMLTQTNSMEAWKLMNNNRSVKVAVVDSGVDAKNPQLSGSVLVDEGYNFVNHSKNTMDDMGHGTEVAAIIAAKQVNGTGISGIVGPANVKILPVKVLNAKGLGDSSIVAKGIVYSVDHGADIINVSIDFDTHDQYIEDALSYAEYYGVLVVVAAGNSGNVCDEYSPAGDRGAYTVVAVDEAGKKPAFSSFGQSVSIAAPGVNILTTSIGNKYVFDSGTSMAAPIVSGIAAMLKAQNGSLKAKELTEILNATATDLQKKGKDVASGYGMINAYKALNIATTFPFRKI